jgi:hypothetical protein
VESFLPGTEIPTRKEQTQLLAAVQPQIGQYIPEVRFHRLGRNAQAGGDLAVGISETGQRGDVLFARREGAPFLQQQAGVGITLQAGCQQV